MKIMVGTPMYGGFCTANYTTSLLDLTLELNKRNHILYPGFLSNESLIQRARNIIAWHFLKSDADYLLFIDADIEFRTSDILRMIDSSKDFIVGPVSFKGMNWKNIKNAALQNKDNLSQYSGIFNIVNLPDIKMKDENTPFEIEYGGCALMLIRRSVFELLIPYTEFYINRGTSIPLNEKVYNFFRVEVDERKFLLSEDYYLCHSYRRIGGKVWCAPWCQTGHLGSHLFNGVYASVSASATNGE